MVSESLALMILLGIVSILWLVTWRIQKNKLTQIQDENGCLDQSIKQLEQQYNDANLDNVRMQEQLRQSESALAHAEAGLQAQIAQLEQLRNQVVVQAKQIAELEATLTSERQSAVEKLALLDEAKNRMANEFKLLANQIFEEKGKRFSEQNRAGLDEILQPMREQLGDFRKRVDEVHLNDSKDRASLKEHLSQLEKLNRRMSEDALNLTHALKGDSKAQGNWGEMILERILESSGLRQNHEYLREDSTTIDVNRRLRPDVIVRMPGEKHIIIDSKVSLTDYERAVSSDDADARRKHVKAHVNSIRQHVKGLAEKHYAHLPGINSPDYVLMFMPIEAAYMMAIEEDQGIFEVAFEKGVAVVTPSTLYATLKLIEQLWRYERQSDDVQKLIERAGKLHDKMAGFVESFTDIGDRLGQAQKAYELSLNRMSSGPGNVLNQIDMLGKLAGKTKKELPRNLAEQAALSSQTDDENE